MLIAAGFLLGLLVLTVIGLVVRARDPAGPEELRSRWVDEVLGIRLPEPDVECVLLGLPGTAAGLELLLRLRLRRGLAVVPAEIEATTLPLIVALPIVLLLIVLLLIVILLIVALLIAPRLLIASGQVFHGKRVAVEVVFLNDEPDVGQGGRDLLQCAHRQLQSLQVRQNVGTVDGEHDRGGAQRLRHPDRVDVRSTQQASQGLGRTTSGRHDVQHVLRVGQITPGPCRLPLAKNVASFEGVPVLDLLAYHRVVLDERSGAEGRTGRVHQYVDILVRRLTAEHLYLVVDGRRRTGPERLRRRKLPQHPQPVERDVVVEQPAPRTTGDAAIVRAGLGHRSRLAAQPVPPVVPVHRRHVVRSGTDERDILVERRLLSIQIEPFGLGQRDDRPYLPDYAFDTGPLDAFDGTVAVILLLRLDNGAGWLCLGVRCAVAPIPITAATATTVIGAGLLHRRRRNDLSFAARQREVLPVPVEQQQQITATLTGRPIRRVPHRPIPERDGLNHLDPDPEPPGQVTQETAEIPVETGPADKRGAQVEQACVPLVHAGTDEVQQTLRVQVAVQGVTGVVVPEHPRQRIEQGPHRPLTLGLAPGHLAGQPR